MNLFKVLLLILGTLSLFAGIIGIIVPGLPTTPFLLLTAGLYIKSSDKLYQKLIGNKLIGSYILGFQRNRGMTRKTKLSAIVIMWAMITISCVFLIRPVTIKIIVSVVGVIGTFVMGFIVPTIDISDNNNK
jgi:uncharacterized protein